VLPERPAPAPPPEPVPEPMPSSMTVPQFTSTQEATTWLRSSGLANTTEFGRMPIADIQEVVEGLATVRPYVKRPLDLLGGGQRAGGRALATYTRTQLRSTGQIVGQKIEFQRSVANQTGIAEKARLARQEFDISKRNRLAKYQRQMDDTTRPHELREIARKNYEKTEEIKRWTIWENTERPTFATIAHEAGHYLYYERGLADAWKAALKKHGVAKAHRVSEYSVSYKDAATNRSELWAEVWSARVTGVSDLIPKEIMDAMEEVLAGAAV
jgi:hypothetical protein